MKTEWDVEIPTDDGHVHRAAVYRPDGGQHPVILSYGPYAKAHGWLRASHRNLDETRSAAWQPFHTHDHIQPLNPEEVYLLRIEIWSTSIVIPPGHRLGLTVRGRDYAGEIEGSDSISTFKNRFTGVGPFLHDDPNDRPPAIFGETTTIHSRPDRPSTIVLPLIPDTKARSSA